MSKSFYPRLAAQNCLKNGKFYFPYLLTVIFTAAAFYINVALSYTPDLPEKQRYAYLSAYMTIGTIVLGIFILIVLIYTNSFLMKRRGKELGLYNVLGMGKRNIGIVLCFESLYTWLIGAGTGILLGMLLQKLMTMLAHKLMRMDLAFDYYISAEGISHTLLYFGAALLLILLRNLRRLHVQNPVELLREGNVGEREPKTRWLLAALGLLCLGAGYYIAISTDDPMEALIMYFVAVILVIIGTYCLFGATSTAVLKALRKNRRFYYKTRNFIGVSGMLHRMNRNAVGLGNICILSTMVLVMISATLSLYIGTEDILDSRYPAQLNAEIRYSAGEPFDAEKAERNIAAAVEEEGLGITGIRSYSYKSLWMDLNGGSSNSLLVFLSAEDYEKLSGQHVELEAGQAMLAGAEMDMEELSLDFTQPDSGESRSISYKLIQGDADFQMSEFQSYMVYDAYIILPDHEALLEITELSRRGEGADTINWRCLIDTDGTPEEQMACSVAISDSETAGLINDDELSWMWYSVASRAENSEDFYSTNGGFFFLGLFLGIIFIMAMVLIMYYKQISEGYEDRERFMIMQQVGLPKKEIRRSINMQVLVVFFAPLVVAGIHVFFDFSMVRVLLTLFGMLNWQLAAWCTLATFGAFALFYAAVYALTAKTYYKIVSEKNAD